MLYISRGREAYQRNFYQQTGLQEQTDAAFFVMQG
jgi:hypothetical protein